MIEKEVSNIIKNMTQFESPKDYNNLELLGVFLGMYDNKSGKYEDYNEILDQVDYKNPTKREPGEVFISFSGCDHITIHEPIRYQSDSSVGRLCILFDQQENTHYLFTWI